MKHKKEIKENKDLMAAILVFMTSKRLFGNLLALQISKH